MVGLPFCPAILFTSLSEGDRQRGSWCYLPCFVRWNALVSSIVRYGFLQVSLICAVVYHQSWALFFEMINFALSKSVACETKDFQKVLGDLIKCFKKGVHPMGGCFVEQRFQMILSIELV